MFHVYSVYNNLRDKIYIGHTIDLVDRIKRHNKKLKNKTKSYTSKNSGHWELIYAEKHKTRSEAMKREKQLKTFKGREFIWNIVEKKYDK